MIPLIILDDSIPKYLVDKENFINIRLHDQYIETSHATLIANSIFHPKLGVNNNFKTYWIQVYNYNKIDLYSLYEALDLIYNTINNGVISIPLGYTVDNLTDNDYKIHKKIDNLLNKISNKFVIVSPCIKDKNLFPSTKNYVVKICDINTKNNEILDGIVWKTEIKKCITFYDNNRYLIDIGESYYTVYLSWWIVNNLNYKNNSIENIILDINNNKPNEQLPECFC